MKVNHTAETAFMVETPIIIASAMETIWVTILFLWCLQLTEHSWISHSKNTNLCWPSDGRNTKGRFVGTS